MFSLITWFIKAVWFFYKVVFVTCGILLQLAALLAACILVNWGVLSAAAYPLGWSSYGDEIFGLAVAMGWVMVFIICEHSGAIRHTKQRGQEISQELKGR